ncbi:HU family DNA-binding protein [Streptomyces sp. NBC_00233]|uniref:HU family DNA-binding protein n=1 Tax=Streptomyces sp. NBC_00233 TaxID=2975686 RepID=UPI00224CCFA0|nr:HU family DNA-binding protein [Streptomyces sp. NBC_00233]MCX5229708.1 HU family DNA-binding protein [Streptomyces sp. NBC_00233]
MHPTIPTTRLNTTALAEAVATELNVPQADGRAAVQAVFDVIARAVAGGFPVAITNFGTFLPVEQPARTRRNPQNGAPVDVPEHRDVRFRVSPGLRATVRTADPESATIRKAPKTVRTAQGEVAGQ